MNFFNSIFLNLYALVTYINLIFFTYSYVLAPKYTYNYVLVTKYPFIKEVSLGCIITFYSVTHICATLFLILFIREYILYKKGIKLSQINIKNRILKIIHRIIFIISLIVTSYTLCVFYYFIILIIYSRLTDILELF